MRKRAQIALGGLLVMLVGVVIWRVLRQREPVYEGKELSVWLEVLVKERMIGDYDDRGEQPIRHIGTNALPVLIEMLHAQDTRLKQLMMTCAKKQKLIHFDFKSAYQRRQEVVLGYAILGPMASVQVPSLIDTLTDAPSPRVRQAAVDALGAIGPEARLATSDLFRATKDTDEGVRNDAFSALSRILPEPQLTIPVLVAGLDDPSPFVRDNAALALGEYGPEARAAVPALLRTLATNRSGGIALKKIDPEAAAKAGVK